MGCPRSRFPVAEDTGQAARQPSRRQFPTKSIPKRAHVLVISFLGEHHLAPAAQVVISEGGGRLSHVDGVADDATRSLDLGYCGHDRLPNLRHFWTLGSPSQFLRLSEEQTSVVAIRADGIRFMTTALQVGGKPGSHTNQRVDCQLIERDVEAVAYVAHRGSQHRKLLVIAECG